MTKIGIKRVCPPPYSPDLAPCDFCLFPKLTGCCYETFEMKEAVTKVIDMLTQGLPWGLPEVVGMVQQVHCSRRRLLRRELEFHGVLSIKVPIRKSLETYRMHLVSMSRFFSGTILKAFLKLIRFQTVIFSGCLRRLFHTQFCLVASSLKWCLNYSSWINVSNLLQSLTQFRLFSSHE